MSKLDAVPPYRKRIISINGAAALGMMKEPVSVVLFALCFFCATGLYAEERGTLMLVRSWDPKSGELIAWMPSHSASMTLKMVEGQDPPDLQVDSAVRAQLPLRPKNREVNLVRAAPESRRFDDREWVPVTRDPNLVHISKTLFYIRSIDFSDKWSTHRREALRSSETPPIQAFDDPGNKP
jgi:hypothetical protein